MHNGCVRMRCSSEPGASHGGLHSGRTADAVVYGRSASPRNACVFLRLALNRCIAASNPLQPAYVRASSDPSPDARCGRGASPSVSTSEAGCRGALRLATRPPSRRPLPSPAAAPLGAAPPAPPGGCVALAPLTPRLLPSPWPSAGSVRCRSIRRARRASRLFTVSTNSRSASRRSSRRMPSVSPTSCAPSLQARSGLVLDWFLSAQGTTPHL